MKFSKVVMLSAMFLSFTSQPAKAFIFTEGLIPGFPVLDSVLDSVLDLDFDARKQKPKKRYRVPAYSKSYKPQKLVKPTRLYGDVRRGW